MHKFIKNTTKKKLVIPNAAMELGGFEKGAPVEIQVMDDAVVILKKEMTAMELIHAVEALQTLTLELNQHLAVSCGPCEGCDGHGGEECPAEPDRTGTVLPEAVRRESGIPDNAKICSWPGEIAGTAMVAAADYRYDLSDVPEWELSVLRSMGVCLEELEERLMSEEVIYG